MIGTSISRYDILEELGQGGMSVVYLARDTGLNRQVAIKLLHEHLAKKPENRKRFRREAEAIARLRHPNILDVYDVSEESDDRSFIVMEYIPGSNLREFIDRNGPPPPEVAALIGVQICNALSHAHKHGVIHRDLKPENVMISESGDVKLMDFGIAHVIDAETMTKTGSLLGSPAHMAPELIDGKKVDERADIFALGTVLYWMSTGRLPFCGDNTPQVLRNVMECRYEEPEVVEPRLSHDLARIICKSLNKDPEDRFASVEAVKRELLASVHAVGFEDGDALLAEYMLAPDQFGEQFEGDIVERLITCGKRAMKRGNVPSAIAYFNRVLAYDAQNEEVRECLDQLDRSRRVWRLAAVAAAVVLVSGAGWLTYEALGPWDDGEPVDDASREAVASAARAETARARSGARARGQQAVSDAVVAGERRVARELATGQAAVLAKHLASSAEALSAKVPRRPLIMQRIEPVPRARMVQVTETDKTKEGDKAAHKPDEQRPQTYSVAFKVLPQSARLEIDGRKVTWQLGPVELERGRHHIKATAPGCKPYSDSLLVNAPRNDKIPVVLEWKDATITVESNRNALVYVGDEVNPRSNARHSTLRVPFGRDTRDPKKTVHLRINDSTNLRRVERREVVVEPGESRVVKVNFP